MFKALGQLAMATKQLRGADAALVERATTAIRAASKEIYQILSED